MRRENRKNLKIFRKNHDFFKKSWFFQKIEIFRKNRDFSKKTKFFENLDFCSIRFSIEIFWKKSRFSEIFEKIMIFQKCFRFFHFLKWNFYGFQNFLMFWKVEAPLVTKSSMSIYEICFHRSLNNVFAKLSKFKGVDKKCTPKRSIKKNKTIWK